MCVFEFFSSFVRFIPFDYGYIFHVVFKSNRSTMIMIINASHMHIIPSNREISLEKNRATNELVIRKTSKYRLSFQKRERERVCMWFYSFCSYIQFYSSKDETTTKDDGISTKRRMESEWGALSTRLVSNHLKFHGMNSRGERVKKKPHKTPREKKTEHTQFVFITCL